MVAFDMKPMVLRHSIQSEVVQDACEGRAIKVFGRQSRWLICLETQSFKILDQETQ